MSTDPDAAGRSLAVYGIVVVAAVLIGTVLAPYAWGAVADSGPSNAIAVVDVSGSITGDSVESLRDTLQDVRANESIEAVVLRVDSPGGTVTASESLYMEVRDTAEEMPVVAYVDGYAASGAYYGIVPTDHIVTKPGTLVGSIGVYARVPGTAPDTYVRSGPDKGLRGTLDDVRRRVEQFQRSFLDTVMAHRGEEISLSRAELAHGKVYSGATAVSYGLADEVGDIDTAIAHAAKAANLGENYQVVERDVTTGSVIILSQSQTGPDRTAVRVESQSFGYDGVQTTQYLMLHGLPATNSSRRMVIGR